MDLCKNKTMEQNFNNFYVYDGNRFAFEIIKNIADNKEIKYSPILVVGKSGTGKSHLMNALENSMKNKLKVVKISSEDFVKSFAEDGIYKEYCQADIFIIENIQFLSNKKQIQNKIFDIMKKLIKDNRKVLLTVGMERKQIRDLDFVNEIIANFEDAIILDIVIDVSDESKHKIIEELKKEYNVTINAGETEILIKECNTIVEMKNRLNARKLLQNVELNGGM